MYDNNKSIESIADGAHAHPAPRSDAHHLGGDGAGEASQSLHVQHDLFADLLTPGWVWPPHPKGCGGADTPAVTCTIDCESFKI
ncbi:hypothetical protein ABT168_35375 [Streptomyces sp. NPDC001793]|uniref:hypothetical protein n=1 Tax=Streptomyces sp. NPDC001793 TaxID=3154657 RepID=UPI00332AF8A8